MLEINNHFKNIILPKIVRWVGFSIVAALIPLISKFITIFLTGKGVSIEKSCANGELFLVSTTLAAVAMGELIASTGALKILKITLGSVSFILMSVTSLSFAFMSANGELAMDAYAVSWGSVWLFIATLVSSTISVAIAEV